MTTATRLRELAEALVSSGGTASETVEVLDVQGTLKREQLAQWAALLADLPIVGVQSLSALNIFGDDVDLAELAANAAEPAEYRIRVTKTVSETTVFCITENGVASLFANDKACEKVCQVWVACDFTPFRAETCRLDVWTEKSAQVFAPEAETIPDPRRLVKNFGAKTVPPSVYPYLLAHEVPTSSEVFVVWMNIAVPRLLRSLVNEVWEEGGVEEVVITGTRAKRIAGALTAPFSTDLLEATTEAARWIYASGRDVDTRFVLFTYELSREWPESRGLQAEFASRGKLALEAAQTAYRAYVQEASKDTLKSLADLRKTLNEEVTKVVSQTRDLLGTMWRDFMVAATAFIGRVILMGSDKPLSNPVPLRVLLFGTAAFMTVSFILALGTNAKFMKIANANRLEWKRKLYGFLSEEDLEKLAEVPLKESTETYKIVAGCVGVGYFAVIACLIWSGLEGASPPQSSGSTTGQQSTMAPSAKSQGLAPKSSVAAGAHLVQPAVSAVPTAAPATSSANSAPTKSHS
jgi:hypothetical protein